jgi:hypothetical protein
MAARLSALHAGRPLPQEDSRYSFMLEAESTLGPSAARRIRSIETCSDLIGNGTPHDRPACSTVLQRAPRPASSMTCSETQFRHGIPADNRTSSKNRRNVSF